MRQLRCEVEQRDSDCAARRERMPAAYPEVVSAVQRSVSKGSPLVIVSPDGGAVAVGRAL